MGGISISARIRSERIISEYGIPAARDIRKKRSTTSYHEIRYDSPTSSPYEYTIDKNISDTIEECSWRICSNPDASATLKERGISNVFSIWSIFQEAVQAASHPRPECCSDSFESVYLTTERPSIAARKRGKTSNRLSLWTCTDRCQILPIPHE